MADTAWDKLCQDYAGWRGDHLLDSVTDMCFADDAPGWDQPHAYWSIHPELRADLETIEGQLRDFANEFLNPSQQIELQSIYNSFESCFFRQDLLDTARDLYPFFRQLGLCFSNLDRWRHYFTGQWADPPHPVVLRWEFARDVEDLITRVQRAIRNRIEHRSVIGDPPFPQTFREGACKIVSAYSYVVHLCSELFRIDGNPGTSQGFGDARHFGACVQAGIQGKVECVEVFASFREFVELYDHGDAEDIRLLSERDDRKGEWSGRLYLVDLPPQSMMRPEIAIVHCLHEMSELGDWICQDRSLELRKVLNKWVLREAQSAFIERVAADYCKRSYTDIGKKVTKERRKQVRASLKEFADRFVRFCLAIYENKDIDDTDSVNEHVDSALSKSHPVSLMTRLMDALEVTGRRQESYLRFEQVMDLGASVHGEVLRPVSALRCAEIVAGDELRGDLGDMRDLATEILGDIGMWFGLHALLVENRAPFPEKDITKHLCKLYASVFQVASEAAHRSKLSDSLQRSVLHRLAIQIAAAVPPANVREVVCGSVRQLIGEEATEAIKESLAHEPLFGNENSLVAGLRRFLPYGGKDDLAFAQVGLLTNDRVVEAFRRTWEKDTEPATEERVKLLWVLWAGSARFAVKRLFKRPSRSA